MFSVQIRLLFMKLQAFDEKHADLLIVSRRHHYLFHSKIQDKIALLHLCLHILKCNFIVVHTTSSLEKVHLKMILHRCFSSALSLCAQVTNLSVQDAHEALLNGPGFVIYPEFKSAREIEQLRSSVYGLVQHTHTNTPVQAAWSSETGHDNIYTTGQRQRQRNKSEEGEEEKEHQDGHRIWNLVNKGQEFEMLVQDPRIMALNDHLLGSDHCLGSFAANVLMPGSSRQLPHLDYPYWDYNDPQAWPENPKLAQSAFLMNVQTVLMLDDFTVENGATAVLPYSQRECRWPDLEEFERDSIRVTGKKGTLFVFTGLLHHAAMDNVSNESRAAVLGQYLPKFVRPMEDPAAVGDAVRQRASDRLLTLLGCRQPYPKNFDVATG